MKTVTIETFESNNLRREFSPLETQPKYTESWVQKSVPTLPMPGANLSHGKCWETCRFRMVEDHPQSEPSAKDSAHSTTRMSHPQGVTATRLATRSPSDIKHPKGQRPTYPFSKPMRPPPESCYTPSVSSSSEKTAREIYTKRQKQNWDDLPSDSSLSDREVVISGPRAHAIDPESRGTRMIAHTDAVHREQKIKNAEMRRQEAEMLRQQNALVSEHGRREGRQASSRQSE